MLRASQDFFVKSSHLPSKACRNGDVNDGPRSFCGEPHGTCFVSSMLCSYVILSHDSNQRSLQYSVKTEVGTSRHGCSSMLQLAQPTSIPHYSYLRTCDWHAGSNRGLQLAVCHKSYVIVNASDVLPWRRRRRARYRYRSLHSATTQYWAA